MFCIGGIISDHVFDSLVHLDLRIQEVFGCSETYGHHLWAKFKAEKGQMVNCHKNQKASILETGELVLSGKNIFSGYLGDEETTKKVIGKNGAYHTGHFIKIMKTRDF